MENHDLPCSLDETYFDIVKMNSMAFVFLLLLSICNVQAGPLAHGICQVNCAPVGVACCSAAGAGFGTVTAGVGVPTAIPVSNWAFGILMQINTTALK